MEQDDFFTVPWPVMIPGVQCEDSPEVHPGRGPLGLWTFTGLNGAVSPLPLIGVITKLQP